MLLFCQQKSLTHLFKMQQDTVGMRAPLTYVMLCWERQFQLTYNSTDISKAKLRAPFVILQCFFSQRWFLIVLSHSFLEQAEKTRWLLRSAWVKFLLWQLSSTWKLHRTGQYASKPSTFFFSYFYQCIHRRCLWVTSKNWTFTKES